MASGDCSVKHGLQLSLSTDAVGTYAVVKCNKVLGNLYLDRLGKRNPGKCVLVGDTWYTPLEVEALGGKRQKKWRQTLSHMGKPLADYNLSFPVVSQPIATPGTVSGETESLSSTRVLDDSSQDSSTGNHSAARIPSQSSQVGLSSVLTQPSGNEHNINTPKPLLVDTVLSFIVAFRLKGDKASLKQVVTERFCNEDVVVAKKLLWENCAVHLEACGLQFHYRRDSDTRSQLMANLEDLLQALDTLDSSGLLPSICCEATQLYRIPPISLDQVAEEVHSNTKALKDLSSTIACLDKKVTSLVESHSASVASNKPSSSYAAATASGLPQSKAANLIPHNSVIPRKSLPLDDRTSNLILFGLPEGSSLVETKKNVDEMLEFLSGKPIQIRDIFRLGKYTEKPSTSFYSRPVLIKLCTAWDRKLVLLRKSNLRHFRIKRLFLREDVSPDHRLRQRSSSQKQPSNVSNVSVQGSVVPPPAVGNSTSSLAKGSTDSSGSLQLRRSTSLPHVVPPSSELLSSDPHSSPTSPSTVVQGSELSDNDST